MPLYLPQAPSFSAQLHRKAAVWLLDHSWPWKQYNSICLLLCLSLGSWTTGSLTNQHRNIWHGPKKQSKRKLLSVDFSVWTQALHYLENMISWGWSGGEHRLHLKPTPFTSPSYLCFPISGIPCSTTHHWSCRPPCSPNSDSFWRLFLGQDIESNPFSECAQVTSSSLYIPPTLLHVNTFCRPQCQWVRDCTLRLAPGELGKAEIGKREHQ